MVCNLVAVFERYFFPPGATIPFVDGFEAFCFGGAAFFGLRNSLLPLRSLLAIKHTPFTFEPRGQRTDPARPASAA